MNCTTVTEPHRIVLNRPYWYAIVTVASLLLSLWAMYLDPVINVDGIDVVRSAFYFLQGEWRAGFSAGQEPVYSALIALLGLATGLSVGHAAYALNACFHAMLVIGFIALVGTLGGGRLARLLAALVILLYPTLNELRSHITGSVPYWACFVWALGWLMHYACEPNRHGLRACLSASMSALLFGLEALVFLLIIPCWWFVRSAERRRLLKIPAIAASAGLILCYALWHTAWQSGVPAPHLFRHPLSFLSGDWHELGQSLGFKLETLRVYFLDEYSQKYDDAALLMTILWLSVIALVRALGFVYFGLATYALFTTKDFSSHTARYWWFVVAVIGVALLVAKVIAGFSVETTDAVTPALVLLAVVPVALERLRDADPDTRRVTRWIWPAVLALVLATGVKGMDLRTDRYHLREAGLWLRANTEPGDSLYSDNPIIAYYSGLGGHRRVTSYSWRKIMNKVQRDEWRKYDYLAVEISHSKRYREAILMRYLDTEPIHVFSGDGGRVLIFDTEYDHER